MEAFLYRASGTFYRWWYWYEERDDWAVAAMTNVLNWGKQLTTPASYRAFVKDVWYLFILYTWGGYVLDTGIGPNRFGKLALTEPTRLAAPALTDEDAIEMVRCRVTGLTGDIGSYDMTLNGGPSTVFERR